MEQSKIEEVRPATRYPANRKTDKKNVNFAENASEPKHKFKQATSRKAKSINPEIVSKETQKMQMPDIYEHLSKYHGVKREEMKFIVPSHFHDGALFEFIDKNGRNLGIARMRLENSLTGAQTALYVKIYFTDLIIEREVFNVEPKSADEP